jgi:hypothetical protein
LTFVINNLYYYNMEVGNAEFSGNVGLLERTDIPKDPLDELIQKATETLFAEHKGNESGQRIISRTFQLIRSLRGMNDEDPFPQDRESMESMAKIQKDLIHTMVDATKSDTSPEELHNIFIVAGIIESFSKQNLPSGIHPKRMENASKVRSWWNGIKAEASIIRGLQTNGYKVEIPEGDDIISLDVRGGIDFLAHPISDNSKTFAIDAKSYSGMTNSSIGSRSDGFLVESPSVTRTSQAVQTIENRNPGRLVKKAVVRVDPKLLPQLRLTTREGELEAFRNFLTLPDSVSKGISQKLNQIN